MTAPTNLYIAPAYLFPKQSDKDKAQLWQDAGWAYDCAYQGRPELTTPILYNWAVNNKKLVNWEAKLVMTFKGQLFLDAYLMLPSGYQPKEFPTWVQNVYLPGAMTVYPENNNRGAWGLLGSVLSNKILGYPQELNTFRYYEIISNNTNDDGLVKDGPERTNSGMWYSYFFIAPLLKVAQILPVEKYMLKPALDWLWKYVQNPETWPYKPAPIWTPKGIYQRLFQACAAKVELPRKDDWPANLYWVAGDMFEQPEWKQWGNPPRYWTNIFRFGI